MVVVVGKASGPWESGDGARVGVLPGLGLRRHRCNPWCWCWCWWAIGKGDQGPESQCRGGQGGCCVVHGSGLGFELGGQALGVIPHHQQIGQGPAAVEGIAKALGLIKPAGGIESADHPLNGAAGR